MDKPPISQPCPHSDQLQQQEQQQQQQAQLNCQQHNDADIRPAIQHPSTPHIDALPDGNSRSPSSVYKRQVTFPSDDALAVVHHLHPSSSAGDLSTWHGQHEEQDPTPPPGCYGRFKASVKRLKRDVLALYYAVHDPRTPLLSKLLPWLVLAYALSPLDLIPDFIPVLGFLDDMLLLPLGLWLSYKLIPKQVMEDSRARADAEPLLLHKNWAVAVLVLVAWCAGLLLLEHWLIERYGSAVLLQWQVVVLAGTAAAVVLVFVVWAMLRVRQEQHIRQHLGGAPLLQYDSSEEEEV